jgi:allantoate deiminase
MRAHAIIERCRALAAMSETPGGLLRTFLSPPMRGVHRLLTEWMENAGMRVSIDAAGNLRGVYPAASEPAKRLTLGSHVDTVPNAGAFDGPLGVVLAVALVEGLEGRKLPFSIEVAAFSEEEGVRFGVPFIGSRALTGTLDAALMGRRDAAGISVEEAIRGYGLDPAHMPDAVLDERTFAYIEFHIEQGPVLESLDLPLGIVTSIVGQSRFHVTFHGQANHAGTTPMRHRRDALAAAARWISLVERHARSAPEMVATVGAFEVTPGAGNVIPGEVRASLDVRHPDDAIRRASATALPDGAQSIGSRRGIAVEWQQRNDQETVACDPCLIAALSRAVTTAGFRVHQMPSGAGHDAMILAARVPAAMLFLRSPGGLSHHPDEAVHAADVEAALSAGAALLSDLERLHA